MYLRAVAKSRWMTANNASVKERSNKRKHQVERLIIIFSGIFFIPFSAKKTFKGTDFRKQPNLFCRMPTYNQVLQALRKLFAELEIFF